MPRRFTWQVASRSWLGDSCTAVTGDPSFTACKHGKHETIAKWCTLYSSQNRSSRRCDTVNLHCFSCHCTLLMITGYDTHTVLELAACHVRCLYIIHSRASMALILSAHTHKLQPKGFCHLAFRTVFTACLLGICPLWPETPVT